LALSSQKLKIALIEAGDWRRQTSPSYDDRAIALSYGARRIFEGMGLWPALATRVTPIEHIHVSDRGRFGFTRLTAHSQGVEALGYVISARDLGGCLMQALTVQATKSQLSILAPASVKQLANSDAYATLKVMMAGQEHILSTPLVVAADGGQSTLRDQAAINSSATDYGQCAIVANLTPDKDPAGVAFERFTPDGPIALLPLSPTPDGTPRCGLVWTRSPADAERLMALDEQAFMAEAQACFGQRLGRFRKIGKRHSYPLQLIRAEEQVRPRLVLIGNAAHTLHPIAGQGFNLGLRDVATLAQVIADALRTGADIGTLVTLEPYAQWRARDQRQVIGFTHFLVQGFSSRFLPLALARNIGLVAMDILPPLKQGLARHAMGLAGKLPRLARGLPL